MNGTRTMMLGAVTPPSGSHADATEVMDQADQSRHPQSQVGASGANLDPFGRQPSNAGLLGWK